MYSGTDLPTTRTRSCVPNVLAHLLLMCVLWIARQHCRRHRKCVANVLLMCCSIVDGIERPELIFHKIAEVPFLPLFRVCVCVCVCVYIYIHLCVCTYICSLRQCTTVWVSARHTCPSWRVSFSRCSKTPWVRTFFFSFGNCFFFTFPPKDSLGKNFKIVICCTLCVCVCVCVKVVEGCRAGGLILSV